MKLRTVIHKTSKGSVGSLLTCDIPEAEPHSKGVPFVCRRGDGEGLALYDGRQVETPYTSCEDYNNLILIPDGNAGRFHEYPFRKAQGNGESKEDSDVRAKHDQ